MPLFLLQEEKQSGKERVGNFLREAVMKKKNIYDGVLSFKGTWRNYQRRVLEEVDQYLEDGKIHIAAAPGAGKTTLGIELIRRMDSPA